MNMGKSAYKVPGGKLIKIELSESNGTIESVKIMGDFFMHPEEAMDSLEKGLAGVAVNHDSIIDAATELMQENNIELFGINAEALAEAIMRARDRGAE